jgi:hypothetical protein
VIKYECCLAELKLRGLDDEFAREMPFVFAMLRRGEFLDSRLIAEGTGLAQNLSWSLRSTWEIDRCHDG